MCPRFKGVPASTIVRCYSPLGCGFGAYFLDYPDRSPYTILLTTDRPLQSKHSGNFHYPYRSHLKLKRLLRFGLRCPPLPPRGETLLGSSGEDFQHFVRNCSPELPRHNVASLLFVWGRSGRWAVTTLGSIQRRSETVQGLTDANSD